MRLASYDIGIKNLAYCILDYDSVKKNITILDWNVINLLEIENNDIICSQTIAGKTKKQPSKPCDCHAKFQKNGQYYCLKHAKKDRYMIPTKRHTKPFLKKQKLEELKQIAVSLFLNPSPSAKKDDLIESIYGIYQKNCYEPIVEKKSENAGDTDLIIIGKRMKLILNLNPLIDTVTHVVIENQISPIATRMKTLQGMLTQYYIDKNSDINIEFVSSVHKLKQFGVAAKKEKVSKKSKKSDKENNTEDAAVCGGGGVTEMETEKETDKKSKTSYKQHKDSGILYCSQILNNNPGFELWKGKMETKKKDDLADCFLQGLWYFKHRNILSYAENLKINLV